jgi:hypothetical protein
MVSSVIIMQTQSVRDDGMVERVTTDNGVIIVAPHDFAHVSWYYKLHEVENCNITQDNVKGSRLKLIKKEH